MHDDPAPLGHGPPWSGPGRPAVLLAIDVATASLEKLRAGYTVHQATTHDARMAVARESGGTVGAIVTNGTTSIPAALIERLPWLGIICARGVGYEGVDLAAARARGIVITNGAGANAESVADHALGLMLAALRDIPRNDALVRSGGWRTGDTMRPIASGKVLGILGLGDIGMRIARRATAFNMVVEYHSRRRVPDVAWTYRSSPLELARHADILIVVLPGGGATRHLVGRAELDALGPAGFLVNVGRGSVVDSEALAAALQDGRIAGAALDVIDGEPEVPDFLRRSPNLILTPHMAGRSPESTAATTDLLIANLDAHFAGRPVLTPVPGGAHPAPASEG